MGGMILEGAEGGRAQGETCEMGRLVATWLSPERGSNLAHCALAAHGFFSRTLKAFMFLFQQPQCPIWTHHLIRGVRCRPEGTFS